MKTLPRLLTTLSLTAAAVAVPVGSAHAISPTADPTVQCIRDTTYTGGPQISVRDWGIGLDPTLPTTVTVTFTDATTLTTVQDAGATELNVQLTPLVATRVPSLLTVSQGSEVFTKNLIGAGACDAAVAPPKVTQNIVAGPDNDTFTVTFPNGQVVTQNEAPWSGGTTTLSFAIQSWDAVANHWFQVGSAVGNAPHYTLGDDGGLPTKQVPETVTTTVAVYSTRTVCTDPVVGTFQVDSYTPKTAAQVNTLVANSTRNTLPYRFDGPNAPQLAKAYMAGSYASLWGNSRVEFVTVKLSDVKRYGTLAGAINAKTTKVANLGGTKAVNKAWTTAWKLAAGATVAKPWTATPTTAAAKAQTEFDAVKVPAPVCTATKVQTGTKQVTTDTGRMITVPRGPLLVGADSVGNIVFN